MVKELTPWRPSREFAPFWSEMDNLFNRFFGESPLLSRQEGWNPSVDISDTDGEIMVKAELPGLEPKDIDVNISGDLLTLRGEKKMEEEKKEKNYYCHERFSGSFQRSFRLPSEVKSEGIEADFKNGVLTIHMPKSEKSQTKKIEIKAG